MLSRNRYYDCAFNKVNGCRCRGISCMNCVRFLGFDANGVARCKCNSVDCGNCKDWISDKATKLQIAGKSCKLCDNCKRECKMPSRSYCNLFEPIEKEVSMEIKQRINYSRYADLYRKRIYKR